MSSVTLEQAWDRVCRLVEEAAQFGRVSRGEGGEVVGWWPAKPRHDALDSDFRIAWLRHEVFTPLDDAEVEELEREIGQALPPLLRRFYTKCSNGLEFASGDLSIYGLRRGTAHDPCELSLETVECRADVEPEHFFFGSWGDDKHLIYLDTRDGSVHVAALRTATPLRTWPSFEEFLRASCEEHVASFDAEGQRIGVAQLPPEPAVEARPASRPLLTLRRDLEAQGRHVEELLESGPEVLALGDGSFVLAKPSELGELQIGYSICPGVEDLTGGEGAWRTEWLVIGTKEDLSDPLFVDLSSPELPVFTAEHGAGAWSPVEVAPSLASALGA